MAHRGKITIKDFHRGQSSSPFVNDGAFAYSQGLDVFREERGIIRLAEKMDVVFGQGDGLTGIPKWTRYDRTFKNAIYMLTSQPALLVSTDGGTTWGTVTPPGGGFTSGSGQGLEIWKDYLFVIGNTAIDVYGPLSGTPTWNKTWQSGLNTDTEWHPCIIGYDDKLYIAHGNDLASIEETGNFDPDTGGTFIFINTVHSIPEGFKIKTLVIANTLLYMGTWKGTNIYDMKVAVIFPWDMESPSFREPIQAMERGINAMENINGIVYVAAGINGQIYILRDTFLQPLVKIPQTLSGGRWVQIHPDAIAEFAGKIVVGVSKGGTNDTICGLFTLDSRKFCFEFIEAEGDTTNKRIGTVFSSGNNSLIMGVLDGSAFQIHRKNTDARRYLGYEGLFQSLMYPVGSIRDLYITERVTVRLARALQLGEGFRLKYREDIDAAWSTAVGTITFSANGAVKSWVFDFVRTFTGSLQVQLELTTGASSNTPLVSEVVIE